MTWKVFHVSFSNLLCMLLMTSSRTSSIMAEKKKNGRFIAIFNILRLKIDLVGAITWKVFHISFLNLLCMLLMTSSRTSSIMAEKKKWPIYCDFSHFTSLIWPCERDKLKSFSHILFKFVMHVTNDQFSDKFNNGKKKKKWPIYCDFSHFTSIIWPCGRKNLKSFSHILFKLVMHITNK